MYQWDKVSSWLISLITLMCLGYMLLLFLPFILAIGVLFAIYIIIKYWLFCYKVKKKNYNFTYDRDDIKEEGTIIDAEYEILDEKQHK